MNWGGRPTFYCLQRVYPPYGAHLPATCQVCSCLHPLPSPHLLLGQVCPQVDGEGIAGGRSRGWGISDSGWLPSHEGFSGPPGPPTDQALHQCVPWTWVSCRAPTLTPGWQAPRFLLSCDGLVQRATPDLLLSTRPHLFPGLRCPCSAQARDGLSRSFVRPASPEGRGLQDGFM